jgi:hypothetical protein
LPQSLAQQCEPFADGVGKSPGHDEPQLFRAAASSLEPHEPEQRRDHEGVYFLCAQRDDRPRRRDDPRRAPQRDARVATGLAAPRPRTQPRTFDARARRMPDNERGQTFARRLPCLRDDARAFRRRRAWHEFQPRALSAQAPHGFQKKSPAAQLPPHDAPRARPRLAPVREEQPARPLTQLPLARPQPHAARPLAHTPLAPRLQQLRQSKPRLLNLLTTDEAMHKEAVDSSQ